MPKILKRLLTKKQATFFWFPLGIDQILREQRHQQDLDYPRPMVQHLTPNLQKFYRQGKAGNVENSHFWRRGCVQQELADQHQIWVVLLWKYPGVQNGCHGLKRWKNLQRPASKFHHSPKGEVPPAQLLQSAQKCEFHLWAGPDEPGEFQAK